MRYTIIGRLSCAVFGLGLALAAAVASLVAGSSAAQAAPNPNPTTLIPIIEVKRVTSADHTFIAKAIDMAIATMEAANQEISVASTTDVQDEAVRSFNTAAAAYNGLADIASQRDMTTEKPKASQLDDAPALAQDAKPGPQDVRYVTTTQQTLEQTIALYHAEAQHGHDRLAVDFAAKMHPQFVHDLELVKVDIENIDHPKVTPSVQVAPDPAVPPTPDPTAPPGSSPSPAPSASP